MTRDRAQSEHQWRIFMTGVILGVLSVPVLQLIPVPWWLELPLALGGLWVIFDVARGWWREREQDRVRGKE